MFYSPNFSFDNIDNDMMDIVLVTTVNDDILNNIGTTYIESIKSQNTKTDNPYYLLESKETETLLLEFAYVDLRDNSPLVWDEDKIDEIVNWLYKDSFKPFVSQDNDEITYYLKATKIYKRFNNEMKGMLEVEFQPYTAYGYKYFEKKVICEGEAETKIKNESTTSSEYYEPIIEVKALEEGNVQIENLSIEEDKPLVIEGMKKDEKIIIDNFTYTVQNELGENKFLSVNRNWIRLKKERNILKITGNCEVVIKCNYPKIV